MRKKFVAFCLLFLLIFNNFGLIIYAQETKYPNYSFEFLGNDNWENFNRKVFIFNLKLNKYVIRPIHTIWASIMPQYGMDRIKSVTNNVEYPIRLVSSLFQRDFVTSKNETIRFFTNTILGVGGMFDPAKKLFNIEQSNENMEQALAGCKMKSGRFFVFPVLSFTTPRGLLGKLLDTALNPCSYIATPVLAMVKACLTLNRTSYYQNAIKLVESTFADPYEIAKMIFGIENYVRCANLDRIDVKNHLFVPYVEEVEKTVEKPKADEKSLAVKKQTENDIVKIEVSSEIVTPDLLYGGAVKDEGLKNYGAENFKLIPDIALIGYNPQSPVIDSMRTALFENPEVSKSIWNGLSIWNRSFTNRIKNSKIAVTDGKPPYTYYYILQKHTSHSPLAIIYPSIGEGINSTHSVLWAKLFYDAGYSVIIQGSHFQWEFVKSMPDDYAPGIPSVDAQKIRTITAKIIEELSEKYNYEFQNKVVFGTSLGALVTLFVGAAEYKDNTLGDTKFISICPPVELLYAIKQIDKNSEDWQKTPEEFKQKVAQTASKVMKLYEVKGDFETEINNLPFDENEAKLITGFLMHQKLSDLIFTLENSSKSKVNSDTYYYINNMNFIDYTKKYILHDNENIDDIAFETSLYSISYFLENSDNYKIYHSVNDYLTNPAQIKKLKNYTKDKLTLFDNGAHLGFLYRKEFLENLKQTILLSD